MKAKFVNEHNVFKPKSSEEVLKNITALVDEFIEERKAYKFYPAHKLIGKYGKGIKLAKKFWEEFPNMVNAGPNFYVAFDNYYYSMFNDNKMFDILKNVYGIKTWNVNKIMGDVINVPYEEKWVKISNMINSFFVILKEQKIIIQFLLDSKGRTDGTGPNAIYFDYDHLKQTLNGTTTEN